MALTLGRLVFVGESTREAAGLPKPPIRGKVIAPEIADAAARVGQMVAKAEAQIADKWAHFETTLGTVQADMQHQARAETECALAAKFVELSTLRQREIENSRENLIQLARLLAERVLRHELSTEPSRLVQLAEQCIAEAGGSTSVVIRGNPEDILVVREPLEALASGRFALELLPDPELARGDLHIESDIGTLDARLGTQIAHLAEALRNSLRP